MWRRVFFSSITFFPCWSKSFLEISRSITKDVVHIVCWKRLPDDPQSPVVCTSKIYFFVCFFSSFMNIRFGFTFQFFMDLWYNYNIGLHWKKKKKGVRNSSIFLAKRKYAYLLLKNNISRKHRDESIFLYYFDGRRKIQNSSTPE